MKTIDQYLRKLNFKTKAMKVKPHIEEVGFVSEIKDGVVLLEGLDNVSFGEMIEFENGIKAFVINLETDMVGAIVLGDYLKLKAGDKAKAMGHQTSILVSEKLLGRVVDPLGGLLDNGPKIGKGKRYSLEKIAPGVVYRYPVTVPLQTGIKAIDALIPIGRGQRELIIGDRGTGKTTLAIDTIINQKGKDVICVYCAIGQRASKVALVIDLLRKNKALKHTIIVNASASDPTTLQYLAPYSATAIAEYFMDKGKDVLVVYDDLTKHAWAYREISLVLRRPAGREAYPGDVFYLHSRLLERSCRLDAKYGGGSITSLPIIETLEGDVSGYIPTNVISITDGQIFLETDLFNSGIRPAINVGVSVSRVGGNAQAKIMKSVAGKLKLDLAQYREMVAFSQFEAELDEKTKKFINRGTKITHILKQNKQSPYRLGLEVAVIWAASKGYLDNISLSKIGEFEKEFVSSLKLKSGSLLKSIESSKKMSEKDEKRIKEIILAYIGKYKEVEDHSED